MPQLRGNEKLGHMTHLPNCDVGRTCMKLADLGSCGGLLDTREEAKPSAGMPLSIDWPVKWDRERCTRLWPLLSGGLVGLLGTSRITEIAIDSRINRHFTHR